MKARHGWRSSTSPRRAFRCGRQGPLTALGYLTHGAAVTTTLIFGVALVALGTGSYVMTGRRSKTALIPAFFGVPVLLLGAVSLASPGLAPGLGYAVLGIAMLGFLGTARAVVQWAKSLGTTDGAGAGTVSKATVSKGLMALLCAGFIGAHFLS